VAAHAALDLRCRFEISEANPAELPGELSEASGKFLGLLVSWAEEASCLVLRYLCVLLFKLFLASNLKG